MTTDVDTSTPWGTVGAAVAPFFNASKHKYLFPRARVEGASFPAMPMPRRAIATGTNPEGTITIGVEPIDYATGPQLEIDLMLSPEPDPGRAVTAAERYANIRRAMSEAGYPLLNDEEVRQEIAERKGVRAEPEA